MPLATRRLQALVAATPILATLLALLWAVPAVQASVSPAPNARQAVARPSMHSALDRVDRREPRAWLVRHGSTVTFAIESLRTRRRDEVVSFTDHVARGQTVRCRSLSAHLARMAPDSHLVWQRKVGLRIIRCGRDRDPRHRGGTLVQARASGTRPGQFLVLAGTARATGAATSGRLHTGAVAQHGYRGRFSASLAAPAPPAPPAPSPPSSTVSAPTTTDSVLPPAPTASAESAPRRAEATGTPRGRPADPAGSQRTATLVGGLLIFLLGATGVTLGLRSRA